MAEKQLVFTTSRQLAMMFFVLLVVNSIVIVLANMMFPNMVVLGTGTLSFWWAVLHSMGKLSLIGILSVPLIEYFQEKQGRLFEMKEWMYAYLIINFAGLWVISRFSEQFGLGLSAWWVTLILAAVMDFAQGIGQMLVYRKPTK